MPAGSMFNAIIFVDAAKEGDRKLAETLASLLKTELRASGVRTFTKSVTSANGLQRFLQALSEWCSSCGMLPILHIDVHGDKAGLEFRDGSRLSWKEFANSTRPLNVVTCNNLIVVLAACYGLHVVESLETDIVFERAPFFALVAPEALIKEREVQLAYDEFYRELAASGDIGRAMNSFENVPPRDDEPDVPRDMRNALLPVELFFAKAVSLYLQDCLPDKLKARAQALLVRRGQGHDEATVAAIIEALRPRHEEFDKLKRVFLMTDLEGNENRFQIEFEGLLASVEYGYAYPL